MRPRALMLLLSLSIAPALNAQSATDSAGIRAAALDYAEGWFEGNPERMARAVSPELVKRIVAHDSVTNRDMIQTMGSSQLVNGTRRGFGRNTPADKQEKDVRIYEIFRGIALARVTMTDWVDYLQLARIDGRWVIVNVLWELKRGPTH